MTLLLWGSSALDRADWHVLMAHIEGVKVLGCMCSPYYWCRYSLKQQYELHELKLMEHLGHKPLISGNTQYHLSFGQNFWIEDIKPRANGITWKTMSDLFLISTVHGCCPCQGHLSDWQQSWGMYGWYKSADSMTTACDPHFSDQWPWHGLYSRHVAQCHSYGQPTCTSVQ